MASVAFLVYSFNEKVGWNPIWDATFFWQCKLHLILNPTCDIHRPFKIINKGNDVNNPIEEHDSGTKKNIGVTTRQKMWEQKR